LLFISAGCSNHFLRARAQDLSQVVMIGLEISGPCVEVSAGPVGTGLGAGGAMGVGLTPCCAYRYDSAGPWFLHLIIVQVQNREPTDWIGWAVPETQEIRRLFFVSPGIWDLFGAFGVELDKPFTPAERWVEVTNFGGAVGIVAVGACAYFNPLQLVDFLTGWFGWDLLRYDIPEAWPDLKRDPLTPGRAYELVEPHNSGI